MFSLEAGCCVVVVDLERGRRGEKRGCNLLGTFSLLLAERERERWDEGMVDGRSEC